MVFNNKAKIRWKTKGPEWDGLWFMGSKIEEAPAIKGEDVLPSSFGFGISIKPSSRILIGSDIIFKKWSIVERVESNKKIDPNLKDVTEFHLGMEYLTSKNIPIRLGLYTQPDYVHDEINEEQIFITIGTGYSFKFKRHEFSFNIAVMDSHLFSTGDKKDTSRNIALIYKF